MRTTVNKLDPSTRSQNEVRLTNAGFPNFFRKPQIVKNRFAPLNRNPFEMIKKVVATNNLLANWMRVAKSNFFAFD